MTEKATSWDVVWGCMDDVVICESSLDLDSDLATDVNTSSTTTSKPYLVLRRPQTHSPPCQITIDFPQHHEIKQVYVRSSARVYEIYYTCSTNKESDDDIHYLSTVRCGPVDPIPPQAPIHHASPSLDLAPCFQYLYEATAQVEDADPLLSLTLRFLSIQSGDYLRIDEVYVFTDPVVSPHIHDSSQHSSGNALMSMLIPTLMQLSKSRITPIQQPTHTSPAQIHDNSSNTNALQTTMLDKPHVPHPITTPPLTTSHIERSLDQLVSRVANIEHLCLKLEDKLLKPINNMEARLVKIEQQLESFLTPHNSTTSNCISYDGIHSHLTSTNMDDCLVQDPPITPSETPLPPCLVQSPASFSSTVPHLLPTAPDVSNADHVEENDTAETLKNPSNQCPNKPSSLSDALTSALAGFLSSASADCTCSEETEITPLPDVKQSDEPVPPPIHVDEANRTNDVSYMEQGSPTRDYCEDKQDFDLEEDGSKKQADSSVDKVIIIDKAIAEGGDPVQVGFAATDDDYLDKAIEEGSDPVQFGFVGTDDDYLDKAITEGGDPVQVGFVGTDDDYLDSPVPVGSGPSENESTCTSQVPGSCTNSCKVTDALHDIINLSNPAVLDFTTSVLDVEFSLQEDSFAKAPLEALLTDMPVFHQDEVESSKEINESSFSGQNDLVFMGNEKNNEICSDPGCISSNTEHEMQNFHDCSRASLI